MERIENAVQSWQEARDTCNAGLADPDGEVFDALHRAYGRLIANTIRRFGYTRWLEYVCVWRARDPRRAADAMGMARRRIEEKKHVRRVLLNFVTGELGKDFERHARGEGLSDALDVELSIYEDAVVDGTTGEAIHKDVHRFMDISSAATFRYISATSRLDQDLTEYDRFVEEGKLQLFHTIWDNYKVLLQTNRTALARMQPRRMDTQSFYETVYQYGFAGNLDASFLESSLKCERSAYSKPTTETVPMIKKEFCQRVFQRDALCSVPGDADPTPSPVHQDSVGVHTEVVDAVAVPPPRLVVFEVLDVNPYGEIHVGDVADAITMCWPLLIQRYRISETVDFNEAGPVGDEPRMLLVRTGSPEIIDSSAVALFSEMFKSMYRWSG